MRSFIFASLILLFGQPALSQQTYQIYDKVFTAHKSTFTHFPTPVYAQTIQLAVPFSQGSMSIECKKTAAFLVQLDLNNCAQNSKSKAYSSIGEIDFEENSGFWVQCDDLFEQASQRDFLDSHAFVNNTIYGFASSFLPNLRSTLEIYQTNPSDEHAQKIDFAKSCNSELSKYYWIKRVDRGI